MADRQNGLLVTLGKRLLGFTSGATTEAKEPDARPAMKTIASYAGSESVRRRLLVPRAARRRPSGRTAWVTTCT